MNETQKDLLKKASLALGAIGVLALMKRRTDKITDKTLKRAELRELLQQHFMWAYTEGPKLSDEEFKKQNHERAQFIRIVTSL